MKKGVDPSVYDQGYYAGRYENIDYQNLKGLDDFDHIYQKAGSMTDFHVQDKIVDFGCGAGHMAFYLYMKYKCGITGVDYSRDALLLCKKNLEILERRPGCSSIREKVRFFLLDINNLPDFEGVKAVFLIDLVEHLYGHELDLLLIKTKKWGGKIKIIIHTDNNYYLKFVQPAINFLSVCFGKTSFQKIKNAKAESAKGHVNLTTPGKLKAKLISHDFKVLKIEYPSIDIAVIKKQMGPIANYRIISYSVLFFGKILYFLRPSFYMLAECRN